MIGTGWIVSGAITALLLTAVIAIVAGIEALAAWWARRRGKRDAMDIEH